MMLILVNGESKELDSDYLFNRSLCFQEREDDEGWVLTKTYCGGPYRLFSGDEREGGQWWIEGSAAYTLASFYVI